MMKYLPEKKCSFFETKSEIFKVSISKKLVSVRTELYQFSDRHNAIAIRIRLKF